MQKRCLQAGNDICYAYGSMLTKEDLQAIGALITNSEEHIRKDMVTKGDLEANNRVLGTIFKVELAETNKRIDASAQEMKAVKKGQERIEQKVDRITEDYEERITRLEEGADLTHKN